jgi:hypothetical protein
VKWPALPDAQVQFNAAGQAQPKLKTPLRDVTTHRLMSPLKVMQRHVQRQLCGIQICER